MEEKKETKKSQYPEAIVGGLIMNQDGLILLGKNKKCQNKFTIVGGHVLLGESLEKAVLREVKEETGLDVVVEKKIGFSDAVFHEDFVSGKHYVFTDFLCRYQGDKEAVKLEEREFEKDEYVWVDPEGALKMDIAVGTKAIIERYLEEKKKDEYLSGWQRCLADFENYKKRQLEERRNSENYIKEDFILQILPVIDNFYSSTDHIPDSQKDDPWVTGIMHIQRQLENILKENGAVEIKVKTGDEFNPEIHEAVQAENKEAKKNNKIKNVVQKGYKMGEKVIRATRVIVE